MMPAQERARLLIADDNEALAMDISMPGMSGFRPRVFHYPLPENKIILASQHAQTAYADEAHARDQGYVLKEAAKRSRPRPRVLAGGSSPRIP